MQLHVSEEINDLLEAAAGISLRMGRRYVGVEHLLAALLENAHLLPAPVADTFRNPLQTVLAEVNRRAWSQGIESVSREVFYTPRCINIVQEAARLAERAGAGPRAPHLLLALLRDHRAAPSRIMDELAQNRAHCVALLQSGLASAPPQPAEPRPESRATATPPQAASAEAHAPANTPAPGSGNSSAESMTRDLSSAARHGQLDPAIGRDAEMLQILQILARKSKNNVMLVGEAGVGKTQLVEGLALKLARDRVAKTLPKYQLLELNMARLLSGTQYRGGFEEKVQDLLKFLEETPGAVLFIDEIHLIMGAGATDGSGIDLANLLKPVLARGEIRVIGATTLREYRNCVEKDPAIERRFQMVRVEELSEDTTGEVLHRLRPSLERHHGVRISNRALLAAIALTARYLPHLNFPDKAIDVIDQACALIRLQSVATKSDPAIAGAAPPAPPGERPKVLPHDIRKVVSQITAIPLEKLTAEERLQLNNLEQKIKERIVGQDTAVALAVAAVKKSRAGLADPKRPDSVLLFLGPSGVGKTQLAKVLAEFIFGSRRHLIRFDMSEYVESHAVSRLLGAPPGYVGSEEEGRLGSAVRSAPFSILLFDEIEKAHPRVFDILLPIFEEGAIKDNRGREINFRNCILIMTSNVGSEVLSENGAGGQRADLVDALRAHFRPEFINRIDQIVPFYPLLAEDVRSILRLEVNVLRKRLLPKRIGIRMYQRAYEYLAARGYSQDFGARELRRAVDQYLTTPMSAMLLEGAIEEGDMVDVLIEDGVFTIRKGQQPAPAASGDPA